MYQGWRQCFASIVSGVRFSKGPPSFGAGRMSTVIAPNAALPRGRGWHPSGVRRQLPPSTNTRPHRSSHSHSLHSSSDHLGKEVTKIMNLFRKLFYGRVAGTLQLAPQPDRDQVRNDAGGYVYALDAWDRVDRFLTLGSEGGTPCVNERALTKANALHLAEMVREDGIGVVRRIVKISESGRAPKVSPAIFALAMCAGFGDEGTRRLALGRGLQAVCRTGSHLLEFASYVEQFRGWGRALRGGVRDWYATKPLGELAYQVVKYQHRSGFTHRDLLRLAHPVADDAERQALYAWIVRAQAPNGAGSLELVRAFERAKAFDAADAEAYATFVRESGLPREALPTEWLREPAVWAALLERRPMTATIRNPETVTRVGLLTPKSEATRAIVARLGDAVWLRKARVHPVAVLA